MAEEEYKGWSIQFARSQDIQGRWSDRTVLGLSYAGGVYERSIGGEIFFEAAQDAESAALTLARDWIDNDGRIQLSQVDPAFFPFRFKIGDRVRWTLNEATEGTVQDGFLSGEMGDSPRVNYQVQKDDGLFFITQQECLERLEEDS
jgi:hypothetical protein